ncbi:MAG: glycosyltransferase family 1 protein [Lachnospiraceae bacterium]|nr:glycosyltransferase family 1 protein [Lachnospiraceae bacterium]
MVLNVMPWFKAGTNDRIFKTLLSGACPVSDKSKWLEENFNDKEDIAFYDLDELEALPGLIEELLQNDAMRDEIIRNGQEKVLRHYTTASVIGEALQKVIDIYYPQ